MILHFAETKEYSSAPFPKKPSPHTPRLKPRTLAPMKPINALILDTNVPKRLTYTVTPFVGKNKQTKLNHSHHEAF